LQSGFVGLEPAMQWRILGNYTNVRKLVVNNNNLYVVTDALLDRIAAAPAAFMAGGAPNVVTIARMPGISDFVASGALGLLATNAGLFRTGNASSVATAANESAVQWTQVSMSESPGPVTRLFVISPTNLEQEFASNPLGGNVYALAAYIGYNQARVYRFVVNALNPGVDANTVQPFPDMYLLNQPTFFANIGAYRNYFVTDGALFTFSRSRYIKAAPFIEILYPNYASGSYAHPSLNTVFLSGINSQDVAKGKTMGRLLRNSITGAWMVGGNFGLMVNE
jgi:hypothetical protein